MDIQQKKTYEKKILKNSYGTDQNVIEPGRLILIHKLIDRFINPVYMVDGPEHSKRPSAQ